MNWYRNAHYHESNKVKRIINDIVAPQIPIDCDYEKITTNCMLYFPDKRGRDVDNYSSVIRKFVHDSLVNNGFIADDKHTYIAYTSASFAGYDKDNPRCEVIIEEI